MLINKSIMPSQKLVFFMMAFLLVGICLFLASAPKAYAANVAPTGLNSTATTTTGLTLNWTWGVGSTGTSTKVYQSADNVTYTVASGTIATTTLSFATTSLSVNTIYYFKVESNGGGTGAATSTAFSVYTLANTANVPTASTPTSTTAIPLTIDANSNPSATEFAILNSTSNNYLDATGASSASPVWQATGTWSGISAIGLTANTSYQFAVIARNGNLVNAATSTASTAIYTLTNVPSAVNISSTKVDAVVISWTGDSTNYYVDNLTNSSNSGWINSTSYTFSGLNCATTYSLRVKGRNGNQIDTAFASTVSQMTVLCSSAASVNAGPAPTIPSGDTPQTMAVTINGGSSQTSSPDVVITLNANSAYQVALSNTADFTGSSFVAYSPTLPWKLSDGNGLKTVYVKFRSAGGSTVTASDSITLSAVTPTPTLNTDVVITAPVINQEVVADNVIVLTNRDNKETYQQGETMKINYQYKNNTAKTVKIKIIRQLLDSFGKVIKSTTASPSIKAGKIFTNNTSEPLAKKLPVGDYMLKITVINGQETSENNLTIHVVKPLVKYFVLDQSLPSATDIAFDEASFNKIKSNKALPVSFNLKYSYTNNSGVKHTTKMVRELIGPDGKAISTQTGKWIMAVGKQNSQVFTQALNKNLAAGTYTIRLSAYDWTTKDLLAVNNLSFTIEAR